MRKRNSPTYFEILTAAKNVLEKEKNYQTRSGAPDYGVIRNRKAILTLIERMGEGLYNDLMDLPIGHGLGLPSEKNKALIQLRAAIKRCEDLGIGEEV